MSEAMESGKALKTKADPFAYTPYDGSKRPFAIGLEMLDVEEWIEPDANLAHYLDEKDRLFGDRRAEVFCAEDGTAAVQKEVLDLLIAHLPVRFPDIYRLENGVISVAPANRSYDVAAWRGAPLELAARLVQEDLVIMRGSPDGYRFVAGAVTFPSTWSPRHMFGKPMSGIHAEVPGFEGRMGAMVDRIFANLPVEKPVWRLNWSLYEDGDLHQPVIRSVTEKWWGEEALDASSVFVRVERQTLRRLPVSKDILFTIKVFVDPADGFRRHPRGRELALGLRDQLLALNGPQLVYKNLTGSRDSLANALQALADEMV